MSGTSFLGGGETVVLGFTDDPVLSSDVMECDDNARRWGAALVPASPLVLGVDVTEDGRRWGGRVDVEPAEVVLAASSKENAWTGTRFVFRDLGIIKMREKKVRCEIALIMKREM